MDKNYTWRVAAGIGVVGALLAICLPRGAGLHAAPQLTATPTSTPYPGPNLISNGSFNSAISDWYQVGMVGAVSNGEYCGTFTTPGTNPWDVIFGSQTAINLEQGHVYRLSFIARANVAGSVRALVSQNAAPYAVYFSQDVALSTSNQNFSYTFTMSAATNPLSAFAFQSGGQPANTYCFDEVVLEELISATNTPTPTSSVPTPMPGPNLVGNGDFSNGKANWFEVGIAGTAPNGEYCGVVSNPGSNPWDVIFGSTSRFTIQRGRTYRVSFSAYALQATNMRVLVSMDHAPWAVYFMVNPSLTTTPQTFSYTFTMSYDTDTASAFALQFGTQAATTYCIDNVQVYDLDGSTPTPTATAVGTATPTPTATSSPTAVPTDVGMYGQVSPKLWYQGRKSAISFTFDDGYKSQVTQLMPMLNQHQLPSTFFIPSAVLNWGGRYGTASDFSTATTNGHEIASQSVNDQDLTGKPIGDSNTSGTLLHELVQSKNTLENLFPGAAPIISFAYSFGAYNNTVTQYTGQYYQAARALGGAANPASPSASQWLTLSSRGVDFGSVSTRTTLDADQPELLATQNWLQQSVIDSSQWGIFLFHEVVPFADLATTPSWQPATIEWLTDLANWLQPHITNKDVWVATFGNVTRYAKERDNLKTWVVSESNNRIEIDVNDGLPDALFAHPITVEITVPATWQQVQFSQGAVGTLGTTAMVVNSMSANGRTYIEVDINPAGGRIVLQDVTPPTYLLYLPQIAR